MVLRLT